jgi:hypothetical protein
LGSSWVQGIEAKGSQVFIVFDQRKACLAMLGKVVGNFNRGWVTDQWDVFWLEIN